MENKEKYSLSMEELSGFCSQIAMMMNSGLGLYEGLEALARTHRNSKNAAVYESVFNKFAERGSLYDALKAEGSWPHYLTEMTGIGERTGHLDRIMEGMASYYSREARIRSAVVSAVTYPIVLGAMMLLILLIMIVKVLPVFRRVLASLGVTVNDAGNSLMNMGVGIAWVVLAVMGVAMLAVIICCLLMKTRARNRVISALMKLFVPVRRINSKLSASRVASVLSMMISGGFPLDEAMEMVPAVLDDDMSAAQVNEMRSRIAEGMSFEDALAGSGMYDELFGCMIRMGCSVGCADSVLAKVASEYETRVEDSVSDLVSIIEPTLVAVLCVVIGAVLLSVMMPMAGIISSII